MKASSIVDLIFRVVLLIFIIVAIYHQDWLQAIFWQLVSVGWRIVDVHELIQKKSEK